MAGTMVETIMSSGYKSNYNGYGFPSQTVSVEEKETEEWQMACMNFMRDEARAQSREKISDLKKYRMLSDEYDYGDSSFSWVVNPMNHKSDEVDDKYGPMDRIQHYPIINSPLNTILGERINRPIQFYCLSEAPRSRNDYYDAKTDMLMDYIMQQKMNYIYSRMQQQGIPIDQKAQQQAQAMLPEKIQDYVDKDYVDTIEQVSNRILKNLWRSQNLELQFIEGFRHGTLCGKEFYGLRVTNGKLNIENLSPFSIFYHKSPSAYWISESQYAGHRQFYTPSSLIDKYRDRLKVEHIEKIEAKLIPSTKGGGNPSITGIKSIDYTTSVFSDWQGNTFDNINRGLIDQMVEEYQVTGTSGSYRSMYGFIETVEAYWKSYRKVGILTWYDENDEEHFDEVDENYEPDEESGESVEWFYLNQVYQGVMIDDDIILDVIPYPHQIFDFNDPDYSPLPIEGTLYSPFNGKTIAITDLMMPWAELYDIVAHELKHDMKKAYGKVMYMDINAIPDIEGFDMDKWMYWCREFGIAWVDGSKKSTFSHYQSADMSFAEQINAKMLLLDKIKMNCDSFAGFSQPRLSDASREQTAQQSQMSIAASVNQTEYFFWKHTQCIQKVLSQAINISKKLLKKSAFLRNLYDDAEIRYITVDADKIVDANVGVYVVHGSQEITRREALRQMAMQAAGKQADPVDMADIIMADTQSEIRQIMKELRTKQQQMAQQQMQVEQDKINREDQRYKGEMDFKREELYAKIESEEYQTFMRTFAFQKDNEKDANSDGTPDILEMSEFFEKRQDNLRKHMRETARDQQNYSLGKERLGIDKKKIAVQQDAIEEKRENQANDLKITQIQARAKSKSSS